MNLRDGLSAARRKITPAESITALSYSQVWLLAARDRFSRKLVVERIDLLDANASKAEC